MAKALYGFHGGPDPRVQAELVTLRARVRELEAELAALRTGPVDVHLEPELDLVLTTQDPALV